MRLIVRAPRSIPIPMRFRYHLLCLEWSVLLEEEEDEGASDVPTLLAALSACSCNPVRDLDTGKRIHSHAVWSGIHSNIYVSNSLINMYAKCASLADARDVFDAMQTRNVVSWNALVLAYALNGEGELALEAITSMQAEGLKPNHRTFVAGLKACGGLSEREHGVEVDGRLVKVSSLEKAFSLHSEALKTTCDADIFFGNSLVDTYARSGNMLDARVVFDRMRYWDVVSWTALILGYAENGEEMLALDLLQRMQVEGSEPNSRTYVAALSGCASLAEKEEQRKVDGRIVPQVYYLQRGMEIHSKAARTCLDSDMYLASALVNMYAKCGSLLDARVVFDGMEAHDVVTWTALVLGYAENGEPELALGLLSYAQLGEVCNSRTYIAGLMACATLAVRENGHYLDSKLVKVDALEKGMSLHADVLKNNYESEVFVANALVDMYLKCGSLVDARRVFDKMAAHDMVSWTTMILGYAESGQEEVALELFARLSPEEKCDTRSARVFVAALVACVNMLSSTGEIKANGKVTKARCLETGMEIHALAGESRCDSNIFVANTLIDLYVKCGSLTRARKVFERMKVHDTVSWNALLLGYSENGENVVALELFQLMLREGKCQPNARTFVAAFQANAGLAEREEAQQVTLLKAGSLERGMEIHARASRSGVDTSNVFVASSLINMYGKCGSILDARRVFDRTEALDVVSLTSLVLACVENGKAQLALDIFHSACIEEELIRPNSRAYAAAVMACGSLAVLYSGRRVHGEICRLGMESDELVANCLVNFYGKCGNMLSSEHTFGSISTRDAVTWSALVAGYARQGNSPQVFAAFETMVEGGVDVNGITFLSVLTACSHSGLVERGKRCFQGMKVRYGVEPGLEHYHCLIDMLARGNRLDEALGVIETMPHEPSVVTWTIVLAACQNWENVVVGKIAYNALLKLDPSQAPTYMLMSNFQDKYTV